MGVVKEILNGGEIKKVTVLLLTVDIEQLPPE